MNLISLKILKELIAIDFLKKSKSTEYENVYNDTFERKYVRYDSYSHPTKVAIDITEEETHYRVTIPSPFDTSIKSITTDWIKFDE